MGVVSSRIITRLMIQAKSHANVVPGLRFKLKFCDSDLWAPVSQFNISCRVSTVTTMPFCSIFSYLLSSMSLDFAISIPNQYQPRSVQFSPLRSCVLSYMFRSIGSSSSVLACSAPFHFISLRSAPFSAPFNQFHVQFRSVPFLVDLVPFMWFHVQFRSVSFRSAQFQSQVHPVPPSSILSAIHFRSGPFNSIQFHFHFHSDQQPR